MTGIRKDAWANANRVVVEEAKPADARGTYRHPQAFGLAAPTAADSLPSGVQIRKDP